MLVGLNSRLHEIHDARPMLSHTRLSFNTDALHNPDVTYSNKMPNSMYPFL